MSNKTKSLLKEQLDALEDIKGDTVPADDVRAFVALVKDFFSGEFSQTQGGKADPVVFGKLSELAKVINNARRELSGVDAKNLHREELPHASQELEEIVKTTEKATNKIVDACERIQSTNSRIKDRLMALDPPIDEDAMMGIEDAFDEAESHISSIYEACNFQDITGQRIKKVMTVLQDIERQVMHLVIVFGLQGKGETLSEADRRELLEEADLLQGPNKKGEGLEQDDIDDILAKLI